MCTRMHEQYTWQPLNLKAFRVTQSANRNKDILLMLISSHIRDSHFDHPHRSVAEMKTDITFKLSHHTFWVDECFLRNHLKTREVLHRYSVYCKSNIDCTVPQDMLEITCYKKTQTTSLMDEKIIMFDDEELKFCKSDLKSFNCLFHMSNLKWRSSINMRLKDIRCITAIDSHLLKIQILQRFWIVSKSNLSTCSVRCKARFHESSTVEN